MSRIFFNGVTHEDVLASMDKDIVAYVDPSLPQFRYEYSRTKARLMGKSGELKEKNARKIKNLNDQINELKTWIHELEELGQITYGKAVISKKTDLGRYYRSKMIRKVRHCLSRSDFAEENLRAFLAIRYKGHKKEFIDSKVERLKNEINDRFESCIKSLKTRLSWKQNQLKLYEP
jgi:hypothetical protein